MLSEKPTKQITVDELERQFSKLSLKVEHAHEEVKASKGYQQEPMMEMPMLRRQDTKKAIINEIDQLVDRCKKFQASMDRKIERLEAEETESKLDGLLNFVLRWL
ncbi:hypothetical protein PG993_013262 [Apiospora rasikravindrae]|uniref:Uncharacterized protein n=1 Tax=Apiospora rasikravindrae TaxID=990691 RepID=A0ABR1RX64_9PEZI